MAFRYATLQGAALAAMLATGAAAQNVTIKLHQFLSAQANVPRLILDVWADRIEGALDNRIKIDRFPAMQLGGRTPELLDRAIGGVDQLDDDPVGGDAGDQAPGTG